MGRVRTVGSVKRSQKRGRNGHRARRNEYYRNCRKTGRDKREMDDVRCTAVFDRPTLNKTLADKRCGRSVDSYEWLGKENRRRVNISVPKRPYADDGGKFNDDRLVRARLVGGRRTFRAVKISRW